ncbi:hypothetical protein ABIF90_007345 [Bradyrhizobium japonicum]
MRPTNPHMLLIKDLARPMLKDSYKASQCYRDRSGLMCSWQLTFTRIHATRHQIVVTVTDPLIGSPIRADHADQRTQAHDRSAVKPLISRYLTLAGAKESRRMSSWYGADSKPRRTQTHQTRFAAISQLPMLVIDLDIRCMHGLDFTGSGRSANAVRHASSTGLDVVIGSGACFFRPDRKPSKICPNSNFGHKFV